MKTLSVLLLAGALLSPGRPFATAQAAPPPGDETASFRFELDASAFQLELRYLGKPVLLYCFAPAQYKPYVKELRTLAGANMLLDAPPDHLHHHGLMYAVKVNGTNFWEETTNAGWQIPASAPHFSTARGQAAFTQILYWVTGANSRHPKPEDVALLIEDRTLRVTARPEDQELAVHWQSRFRVGPAASSVTVGGTHYHGLGLRLPKTFDFVATRLNSAGLPYKPEGTDEVTAARWGAMIHEVEGAPVTVALLSDPANRAAPRMFSMLKGFAYLSATQGLNEQPLTYRKGDPFELNYLLILRSGRMTATELELRNQRWLAERR